jgi:phosphatidylserine/phosphatidylglycerophosphate/cardiolipin synthase-like enzyme
MRMLSALAQSAMATVARRSANAPWKGRPRIPSDKQSLQYETEVAQLRRGSFGRGLQGDEPRTYSLAGVPVKVLFAPDHTPELELMKQMLKVKAADPDTGLAGGSIAFAIFTFAGSSGIDDAMLALARGGVSVKGVLDRGQAMQGWAAPEWLRHERIELRLPPKDNPDFDVRKLHHKLMVIDDRTVIAGSFNYTQPANDYNDENIFVIGSPYDTVGDITVNGQHCQAIAQHLRAEIDRILNVSDPCDPGQRRARRHHY